MQVMNYKQVTPINPLIPTRDYHVTSPYNTRRVSSKQVMRKLKLVSYLICYLDPTPNFVPSLEGNE